MRISILHGLDREGLIEDVTFEQRQEEIKGVEAHEDDRMTYLGVRRSGRGIASAKTMRWEHAWHFRGTARNASAVGAETMIERQWVREGMGSSGRAL